MVRAAVLASGEGSKLQAILDAIYFNEIPDLELVAVICPQRDAYAMTRALNAGIPAFVVDPELFPNSTSHSMAVANKLKDICELYILADSERIKKYKANPPQLNGNVVGLKYVTPEEGFEADLIIISVKSDGLDSAIGYIKNFIVQNTTIISLMNGVSSERKIAEIYGTDKVLHSYFIGHSAVRCENKVTQDGVGKIVFGSPLKGNSSKVAALADFLKTNNIDYEMPDDILYSLWLKFAFNVYANQISAVMNLSFGEMKKLKESGGYFTTLVEKIILEVIQIAEKEGVSNSKNLKEDAFKLLDLMCDEGKTSMLQDILAKRKTEVDIFAGEVVKLGEKYNIQMPYNKMLYNMIKVLEEKNK